MSYWSDAPKEVPKMEVNEDNMRQYFNEIVTKFVGLSEQAQKVEQLMHQVDNLSNKVIELERSNDNLKRELDEAWAYSRKVEQERGGFELELNNAREHTKALSETIVARDNRVTDLERQIGDANNTVATMDHELSVANNRNHDLDLLVADYKQQLEEMTQERDNWRQDAQNAGNKVAELNAQLEKLRSILNPTAWQPIVVTA